MLIRKLAGATMSAITALAALAVLPPSASASNPEVCTPVVVVPLRGSGEGYVLEGDTGWGGPTLHKLLSETDLMGAPVLQVAAPEYPAVPVEWAHLGGDDEATHLFLSAHNGGHEAYRVYQRYVGAQPAYCAPPEVVIIGFSQGAMAARFAAMHLAGDDPNDENGPVSAVHLVGDPLQMPDVSTTFGGGSNGLGIARAFDDSFDEYYDIPNIRRVSLCHNNDPVCDAPSNLTDWSTHKNYFNPGVKFVLGAGLEPSDTDEVDFMANALSTSIEQAQLRYGAGPLVRPMKDLYDVGETVVATYAWSTPAPEGATFSSNHMYDSLTQCGIGLGIYAPSYYSPNFGERIDALDLYDIRINGQRITDLRQISLDGVPLSPGQTVTTVTVRVDNSQLSRAAVLTFGPDGTPVAPGVGSVAEFDADGNGRLEGDEKYRAFASLIDGYCSTDPRFSPDWFWHAEIRDPENSWPPVAMWEDGPSLTFSMLASGPAAPYYSFPRRQPISATVAGLNFGTRYIVELNSEPIVLGEFTASQFGIGEVEIVIPEAASLGEHALVIRSEQGEEVARKRLTVREGEPSATPTVMMLSPETSDPAGPSDPVDPNDPGDPQDPEDPGDPADPDDSPTGSLGSLAFS